MLHKLVNCAMGTLPLVGIRGLEEGCASEILEDVEWEAAMRRAAARAQPQARQKAEVVERIPCASETLADAEAEGSKGDLTIANSLLFEKNEHVMNELFEAQPLDEVEIAREDTSSDPIELPCAIAGTDLHVAKGDLKETPASRAAGFAVGQPDVPGPAWLYPKPQASEPHPSLAAMYSLGEVPESLEHSKERIASRWFALRSVFTRHHTERSDERVAETAKNRQAPIVAVFSVAGGAGKTSLVATLGRALSFFGERVLLSDTTSHGLLPFYFGASQLVSGAVRTFTPPAGSTDAPIQLLIYDVANESDEEESQAGMVNALMENSQRSNRVLLEVGLNSSKIVNSLRHLKPTILVPLLPDMNSVISIDAVQKLFGSMLDGEGRPVQPVYLLNQFDASLPLHLDIREVLKQQVGDRLLPFVIRRSASIGEALAEGMTIVDYDAGSAVAEDYLRVANWLRSITAPVAVGFRNQRWREQ